MRSRTWACLYEPHLTSRLLVKTSIPAQTLICAQHMYTHLTVSSTDRVKTHKHPQQYALNSTTSISSKMHNWIGLDIKHSSLAAAQESNIQENNSLKYLIKRKDYCKLNLMARPYRGWWTAESHLAGEQRNVTHCSQASCGTDPEARMTQN